MAIPAILILVIFILYITGLWDRILGKAVSKSPASYEHLEPLAEDLVSTRMSYYHLLERDEQGLFLDRTFQVMSSLDFVSREEGFEVTDEMRILVSAALTQLTFGWTETIPPSLTQIDLFSESFYSRAAQAEVKGLTLPGRTMLSWRYFQEGYRINNDKINLGLHELAHAVWDERYSDSKVSHSLSQWESIANVEFGRMQRHVDSDFFRDYAATNLQELWACSIECFFEAPEEFQRKLPNLYSSLSEMLNQDMVGRVRNARSMPVSA